MVSDSQLIKLSLFITIIGILTIFILTLFIKPLEISISEISTSHFGREIITNGTIISYSSNGNIFMTISDGKSEIKAVIFENNAANAYNLNNGDRILILGEVNNYKGELEIIVTEVEKL